MLFQIFMIYFPFHIAYTELNHPSIYSVHSSTSNCIYPMHIHTDLSHCICNRRSSSSPVPRPRSSSSSSVWRVGQEMKCNQINLEQNGTLELGGNACYGQICCSVALLRCSTSTSSCSFSQLFIQIILLENAIRGAKGGAGGEQLPAQLISSRMEKGAFCFFLMKIHFLVCFAPLHVAPKMKMMMMRRHHSSCLPHSPSATAMQVNYVCM